jgi:hypothetical protein
MTKKSNPPAPPKLSLNVSFGERKQHLKKQLIYHETRPVLLSKKSEWGDENKTPWPRYLAWLSAAAAARTFL